MRDGPSKRDAVSKHIAKIVPIVVSVAWLCSAGCAGVQHAKVSAPAESTHGTVSVPESTRSTAAAYPHQETALPAESNPPGDIPDSQTFVKYHSLRGRYEIDSPEGWARNLTGSAVTFTDKYDGENVAVAAAQTAPAAESRTPQVMAIRKSGRAIQIESIRRVRLPSGAAVLVDFLSNSEPNPVTGKRVRLENNQYLFFKNGRLVSLTLWAPLGSDNSDQWLHIARSFRWK
jgi:hypothetical protein